MVDQGFDISSNSSSWAWNFRGNATRVEGSTKAHRDSSRGSVRLARTDLRRASLCWTFDVPLFGTRKRKKVGFGWPFLFRESTSLLLATKTETSCRFESPARAFQLSWKVGWLLCFEAGGTVSSICRVASAWRGSGTLLASIRCRRGLPFLCSGLSAVVCWRIHCWCAYHYGHGLTICFHSSLFLLH